MSVVTEVLSGNHESYVVWVVSVIVSLAVFAINSKINYAALKAEMATQKLELKIDREYLKPAFDKFFSMLRQFEQQLGAFKSNQNRCCRHCNNSEEDNDDGT